MRKLTLVMIAAGLLLGGITYKTKNDTEALRAEVAIMKAECAKSSKKVESLKKQRDALKAEIATVAKDRRTGIHKGQLKETIRSTLSYLGAKNIAGWTRLLMVTAAAESDCGFYIRQVRGPARGIMQIEPATERATLRWLKKHHPKDYAKVKGLRVPARLSTHEMQYNSAYCIAVAYHLYRWRKVDPAKMNQDRLVRAYKDAFNTYLGAATIDGVKAKLQAFNIK